MNLHLYDLIVVAIYLVVLFGIGLSFSRKKLDDDSYLLSARKLSLPAFVMTLVTTWYGAILGVGEFVFGYGIVGWVVNGLFWYVVYFAFAFFLAKKIHNSNFLTVADQFRERVGKNSARFAAILTYIMTTPAPYVLSLAVLLNFVFGISMILSVVGGLVVSALYIWFGGFKAVVRTDVFQFVFMYFGFAVLLVLSVLKFGGFEFLTNNLPATHLTFQGELSMQTIFVWGFIAFWTFVDPNFYQRCYAAESSATAKKGILWSIFFWFIFDMLTLFTGLYARAAFPEADPLFSYLVLSADVMPVILNGVFFVTILAIIMSTIDSFLFASSTIIASDFLKKKWKGISMKKLVRIGIIITLLLSFVFIQLFESIIGIIYAVGTVGVSALLIPMLLILFSKKLQLKDSRVLFSMIFAALISSYWLIDGWVVAEYGWPVYRYGIEPMYIGLLASAFSLGVSELFGSKRQL